MWNESFFSAPQLKRNPLGRPISKRLKVTPAEFAKARDKLFSELTLIHDAWEQYQTLFMRGPERVAMLNACARWFFGSTRRLLIREVLLGIARLTDSPKLGGFDNLTVAILLRDPALKGQSGLRARLRRRIESAIKIAQPIRTHRNKMIAHLDHAVVQGAATVVLPKIPSGTINRVLRALAAAYNEHGRNVLNTDTSFELRPLGSVDALIRILESSDRWVRFQKLNDPKTST